MKTMILAAAAALSIAAAASPAQAALYDFTLSGNNVTGSGVFTTQDTANADGGYLITMTTGTINFNNTFDITGPNNFAGADNLLFADTTPYLDFNGTSFHLSNGSDVNIYYSSNYKYIRTNGNVKNLDSFTITPEAAAVPEPATWAMMIGGFGLVGLGMRRRSGRAIQAI